jgi:hypothetical protein
MRRDDGTLEDQFVDFVRTRSEYHRRVAVLLAGEWQAGTDRSTVSFGDFGVSVRVTAPPASDVIYQN